MYKQYVQSNLSHYKFNIIHCYEKRSIHRQSGIHLLQFWTLAVGANHLTQRESNVCLKIIARNNYMGGKGICQFQVELTLKL